jgi:alpha-glucuronidase
MLCQAIPTLDKADREGLLASLSDPAMTAAGISRALRAEGYTIKANTVSRHRRGECSQR